MDDVINVSGHRIGTAEVEGALTTCHLCTEAAVVPVEHPIKGQGIYAFVSLMEANFHSPSSELLAALDELSKCWPESLHAKTKIQKAKNLNPPKAQLHLC